MQWMLSALSGELDFAEWFLSLLNQGKDAFLQDFSYIMAAIIAPAAVLMLLKFALPVGANAQKTAAFVCRLSCIASLTAVFARMQSISEALLHEVAALSNVLTPILISSAALAGAETSAAFLSPMTALCANLTENMLAVWGIAISTAASGIAIAGNLSSTIQLKRLHGMLKRILHWGTGGLLAAFTAILTLQGRLGAGRDSAAARTARYAIENLIPVVGGNVSDSLDSLLSTAQMVKNALGVSGLMLLANVFIEPVIKMIGTILLVHFSAAIIEPLGEESLISFAEQFADSIEMLLITCTTAIVLCMLLIGSCISTTSSLR